MNIWRNYSMVKDITKEVLKSQKTVFTTMNFQMLSGSTELKTLKWKLYYYLKKGELYHIRRGFYAKDKDYDRYEFATKFFSPAYISFETVLLKEGIIFQWYQTIFVASHQSKTVTIDGQAYTARQIKSSILFESTGIEKKDNYSIACVERSFLDMVYIFEKYQYDNLGSLNWDKVYEILPIYQNKKMEQRVRKYHATWKESL